MARPEAVVICPGLSDNPKNVTRPGTVQCRGVSLIKRVGFDRTDYFAVLAMTEPTSLRHRRQHFRGLALVGGLLIGIP